MKTAPTSCPCGPSRWSVTEPCRVQRAPSRAGGWWGSREQEGAHGPHLSLHLGFGTPHALPPKGWQDRVGTGTDPGPCCGPGGGLPAQGGLVQPEGAIGPGRASLGQGVTYLPPEKCPPAGCSPRTPGPCAGPALMRGSDTWVWGPPAPSVCTWNETHIPGA